MCTSERNGLPDWSSLLPPLVGRIYTFLNRKDQRSMALVCRSWMKEFCSPSVWRRIKFILSTTADRNILYRELDMAGRFNKMVRAIEIVCKNIDSPTACWIWASLRIYLLRHVDGEPQLDFFKLENFKELSRFFKPLDDTSKYEEGSIYSTYYDIFNVLIDLLCHQKKAKRIELLGCCFDLEEALKFLSVLTSRNGLKDRSLKIREFVHRDAGLELKKLSTKQFLPIHNLIYLDQLDIDYKWLFPNFVSGPHQYQQNALEKLNEAERLLLRTIRPSRDEGNLCRINLHCFLPFQDEYSIISPSHWKCLKEKCPKLWVDLILKVGPTSEGAWVDDLATILVRQMPLRSLHLSARKHNPTAFHALFRHLIVSRLNECVESVIINWPCIPDSLNVDFSWFQLSCSKLEKFCVYIDSQNYKNCMVPSNLKDPYRNIFIVDTVEKAKEATAFLRTLKNSS